MNTIDLLKQTLERLEEAKADFARFAMLWQEMNLLMNKHLGSDQTNGHTDDADIKVLSDRERDVLMCLAVGKKLREIAEELKISKDTVNAHRANMQKKLHIENAYELKKFAMELRRKGQI